MSKHDELAQTLAETLIREIENNPGQWSKPWKADGLASYPHNVTTNKPYTGGNVFVLFMIGNARGYSTGQWATFKQWNAAGCKIRKGETGTKLARWNVVYKHPGKAKSQRQACCTECKKTMIPTTFTVFNAAQVEGDVTAAPDFPTGRPATLPGPMRSGPTSGGSALIGERSPAMAPTTPRAVTTSSPLRRSSSPPSAGSPGPWLTSSPTGRATPTECPGTSPASSGASPTP